MADLRGFNANDYEPSRDFDPIPAGKYLAVITESEMKETKSGQGRYLQLTFQIIEGEYKNRILWVRLNLDNPNDTAVKIARGELSAICRAVGIMSPNDSLELHNLPMQITVKCKKRMDTGEISNEVRGFSQKEQPPVATTSHGGNNGKPPWKP